MKTLKERFLGYLIAIAAVAAAALLGLIFDPWLGGESNLVIQLGAIALAVWAGGAAPALLAVVLGYAASRYLFMEPRGHLSLSGLADALVLLIYLISSLLIVAIGEALRRARAVAKHDRDSLNLALEAANMNTFDVDLDGSTAKRSENAVRFYGLDARDDSRDAFLRNVHPDDRPIHLNAIQESRRTGKDFSYRFRFIRPVDKRVMWVEAHGRVISDKAGKARFVGTSLDVTERVAMEQQLAEQAKILAQGSQRKSEFIATLAHELRNPLAPIKTCIRLLKDSRTDEHAKESALQVLERQTETIERLIEDLLDVSRIEQGKMALQVGKVDLGSIIKKAKEESMPHLDAKSQRLSVHVPEQPVFVNVDEGRMIQVVSNLLNNSAKFTAKNGSVSITASTEGDKARISVKDNGIGIPPENLKTIFEVFFQAGDRGVNGFNAGLGLGLSLSKALVEMHGGTIEARSEGRGKGSEFIIRLPLAI